MMLKHSRWSGRRLMPSGGGWMTPNPTGGVAACLVWSKDDRRQSDGDIVSTATSVTRSNAGNESEQPQMKPATCGDVNV